MTRQSEIRLAMLTGGAGLSGLCLVAGHFHVLTPESASWFAGFAWAVATFSGKLSQPRREAPQETPLNVAAEPGQTNVRRRRPIPHRHLPPADLTEFHKDKPIEGGLTAFVYIDPETGEITTSGRPGSPPA
jgi:hypothetical protein